VKTRRFLLILLILAVLTPLGLWLPHRFQAGDAWGEWSPEDVGEQVGFIPRGLARLSGLWKAPIPDYAPEGWEERPLATQSGAYIVSALIGIAVCGLFMLLLGRWLSKKDKEHAS